MATKKSGSRKYGTAAAKSVEREMKAFKEGKLKSGSGAKVTNPKQAIAIGLSEAARRRREDAAASGRFGRGKEAVREEDRREGVREEDRREGGCEEDRVGEITALLFVGSSCRCRCRWSGGRCRGAAAAGAESPVAGVEAPSGELWAGLAEP